MAMKPNKNLSRAHSHLALEHCNTGLKLDKANARIAELTAEVAKMRNEQVATRRRLMQAAGFGALLSEILGSGSDIHSELKDRIRMAVDDNEAYFDIARNALKEG